MRDVALFFLLLAVLGSAQFATHSPYEPSPDWPASCATPSSVYLLSRHGIREPSKKLIARCHELQDLVNASKLAWLRAWRNPFADADDLVGRGLDELRAAGARLRHRIGLAKTEKGVPDRAYDARSTHVRRAARSGVAFCQGVEGGPQAAPFVSMESESRDQLLRPFKLCKPYMRALRSPSLLHQHRVFGKKHFPAIAARLQRETGLAAMSGADVGLFWEICAYERALFNASNRFCTLFSAADNELMSYWTDLSFYYRRGYGNNQTRLLSVAMGDEMRSFFSVNRTSGAKMLLRFAHAETVLPLFVFLGLFRDEKPLLASAPEAVWKARQWNTNRICPFEANVAVFRTSCDGKDSIVVQVNEKTVRQSTSEAFLRQLQEASTDRSCAKPASTLAGWFGC